ncbi:hypothetical protein EMPS_02855 [Entomortierella parvispora]|uniref:Uncharacterized protein n=1 Tax=Entomortierella parvispora TaxID=205924 RepID=A0A9P3H5H6_9FUNG|nr:hypothetical protein EMPS_02855 [Entomortierella parvispora]
MSSAGPNSPASVSMMMLSSPPGGTSSSGMISTSGTSSNSSGAGNSSIGTISSTQSLFLNSLSNGALDAFPGLLGKRAATWRYMQRVYQGGTVLYNTALLSDEDLRHGYTDEKMQRRALQYFLLGTSLATILEIPSMADCLKALHGVVQEYEYFTGSESRSKMIFFRTTIRKGTEGVIKPFEETGEYSLLEVRTVPFHLDYVVTFASLCDVIAQVYERLGAHDQDMCMNLTHLEMFQKIDGRFKKILALVSKELETIAREVMVDELSSINPLGSWSGHDDWDV